uniref:SFRICE_034306 n=1 Tax=Spodoptera frugiperda TaxID=7108 RepID=A0A2H1X2T5_SPOFR
MFRCLSVNHAEGTEQIFMKFSTQTGYELTWMIGYFLSHGNTGEADGRFQRIQVSSSALQATVNSLKNAESIH